MHSGNRTVRATPSIRRSPLLLQKQPDISLLSLLHTRRRFLADYRLQERCSRGRPQRRILRNARRRSGGICFGGVAADSTSSTPTSTARSARSTRLGGAALGLGIGPVAAADAAMGMRVFRTSCSTCFVSFCLASAAVELVAIGEE